MFPKANPTNVQPLGAPERLLVNRVHTALMLGLSVPSIIRLELRRPAHRDQALQKTFGDDLLSPRPGVRSCGGADPTMTAQGRNIGFFDRPQTSEPCARATPNRAIIAA